MNESCRKYVVYRYDAKSEIKHDQSMHKYDCNCTKFLIICSVLSQQTTGRLETTRIFYKEILWDSASTLSLIEKSSEVNLMIMPSYRIINDYF